MKGILLLLLLSTLTSLARPPKSGWYEFNNPFDLIELPFEHDFLEVIAQKGFRTITINNKYYYFTKNRLDSVIKLSEETKEFKIIYSYDNLNRLIAKKFRYNEFGNNQSIDSIFYDSNGNIKETVTWWYNFKKIKNKIDTKKCLSKILIHKENDTLIFYRDIIKNENYTYHKGKSKFVASERLSKSYQYPMLKDSISYFDGKDLYYYKLDTLSDYVLGQETHYNEKGKISETINYSYIIGKIESKETYYYDCLNRLIRKDIYNEYGSINRSHGFYYNIRELITCSVWVYNWTSSNKTDCESEIENFDYYSGWKTKK